MKRVKVLSLKILFFKLKVLKILSITILIVAVVGGSASALFIYFFPKERVQKLIENAAEDILHRKIQVKGLDYGFRGISLKDFVLFDGTDTKSPLIAKADTVSLGVSLTSLLDRELNITKISFSGLLLNIEFDKNKQSNIERLLKDLMGDDTVKDPSLEDEKAESALTTKIALIRLKNSKLSLKNAPDFLKPLEGTYSLDTEISLANPGVIGVYNAEIKLPGQRGTLLPVLDIKPKEDDFEITGKVQLKNAALPWVYKFGNRVWQPYNVVNATVTSLTITSSYVLGHVNGSCTLRNSPKKLSVDGDCKVTFFPGSVHITQVAGKLDDSPVKLSNLHFTTNGKLISFNAQTDKLEFSDLAPILFFLPFDKFYGSAEGTISYGNNKYNGSLKLNNVGFDKKNRIISGLNTTLNMRNNLIKVQDISCNIFDQPGKISVAVTEPDVDDYVIKTIFLNIRMKEFDFDKVPTSLYTSPKGTKQSSTGSSKPFSLPLTLRGNISAGFLKYNTLKFDSFNLAYALSGSRIYLNALSTKFMGGELMGKGGINLAPAKPIVTTKVQFNGIKVQNFAKLNSKLNKRFYGIIDGRGNLDFRITKEFYKTLNGDVEFRVDKGKVVDTGIQNGLGVWLGELKYKLRDLEFKTIYGNLNLQGVDYRIRSFIFNSEDVKLKLAGDLNNKLESKRLDLNLELNKRFLQDLPRAAVLLTLRKYQRGDWYIVPFRVKGDITESKNLKLLNK